MLHRLIIKSRKYRETKLRFNLIAGLYNYELDLSKPS